MKSYYTELHKGGTKEHRDFRSLLPPQRPARFTRSDIEGRKLQVNMFQVAGSDQKELYGKYWSKRTLEPFVMFSEIISGMGLCGLISPSGARGRAWAERAPSNKHLATSKVLSSRLIHLTT